MKTISVLLAILCFSLIFLIGILTNILREEKGGSKIEKKPYSFSRFQLWLWTLILSPAFVLNWGFNYPDDPGYM